MAVNYSEPVRDGGLQPLDARFLSCRQRECHNLHFYDSITVQWEIKRPVILQESVLIRLTEGHWVYGVIIGPFVFIISECSISDIMCMRLVVFYDWWPGKGIKHEGVCSFIGI